ncbi:hypothetical protein CLOP_g8534 [Closterium sp. NIES-67]|nr:hypothetical protein CLOP_g8534 [Closterium sp. NIES-67]
MVGSLLYAAVHTRPDISFAVGQLARVVQNPTEEQYGAAERVVRYLKSYPTPADFLTKRLAEEPHWRCARMARMSLN